MTDVARTLKPPMSALRHLAFHLAIRFGERIRPEKRARRITAIAAYSGDGADRLLWRCLDDPNDHVALAAAGILKARGGQLDRLLARLRSIGTREAIEAIVRFGAAAVPTLIQMLPSNRLVSSDRWFRSREREYETIVRALAAIGDEVAVLPLCEELRHVPRTCIVEALGVLGDSRAITPVAFVPDDARWCEPLSKREALCRIAECDTERYLEIAFSWMPARGTDLLMDVAEQACTPLVVDWFAEIAAHEIDAAPRKSYSSPSLLQKVFQRLKRHDSDRYTRVLLSALGSPCSFVRMDAVTEMSGNPHPDILAALASALSDGEPHVCGSAARALRAHGWHPPTGPLAALFHVALGEWDAAAEIGPAAHAVLYQCLTAWEQEDRQAAAAALEKAAWKPRNDEEEAMLLLAKESLDARQFMDRLLHDHNPKAIPALVAKVWGSYSTRDFYPYQRLKWILTEEPSRFTQNDLKAICSLDKVQMRAATVPDNAPPEDWSFDFGDLKELARQELNQREGRMAQQEGDAAGKESC